MIFKDNLKGEKLRTRILKISTVLNYRRLKIIAFWKTFFSLEEIDQPDIFP